MIKNKGLKSCRFCGGKSFIKKTITIPYPKINVIRTEWKITCVNNCLTEFLYSNGPKKKDAVRIWNELEKNYEYVEAQIIFKDGRKKDYGFWRIKPD